MEIDQQNIINKDMDYISSNLNFNLNLFANSQILITGGAGFIGYYLVNFFFYLDKKNILKKNSKIYIWDSFIRGKPLWLEEISKKSKKIHIKKVDISSYKIPKKYCFDYIIHSASIASPSFYRKYPIETMDANVWGLRNLLNFSLQKSKTKKKIKGFLYFSTSEIYGNPDKKNIPTKENYNGNVSCVGPRSSYDESKRFGETLCINFSQQHKLPIKIVRPFNNYGPGLKLKDKRLIPDIMNNILNKKNIIIFSDGKPTRTFCYIADAIHGYLNVLIKGKSGNYYNIGYDKDQLSVIELANKIKRISSKIINFKPKIKVKKSEDKNYLVDNPQRRCPNIDKARKEIKYNPKIGLDEGIFRTIQWYQSNMKFK